jgi:hypothetical protein
MMEKVKERGVASYALSKKDLRGIDPGLDIDWTGCQLDRRGKTSEARV